MHFELKKFRFHFVSDIFIGSGKKPIRYFFSRYCWIKMVELEFNVGRACDRRHLKKWRNEICSVSFIDEIQGTGIGVYILDEEFIATARGAPICLELAFEAKEKRAMVAKIDVAKVSLCWRVRRIACLCWRCCMLAALTNLNPFTVINSTMKPQQRASQLLSKRSHECLNRFARFVNWFYAMEVK